MTIPVWDYVFYGGDLPQTDIPADSLRCRIICILNIDIHTCIQVASLKLNACVGGRAHKTKNKTNLNHFMHV